MLETENCADATAAATRAPVFASQHPVDDSRYSGDVAQGDPERLVSVRRAAVSYAVCALRSRSVVRGPSYTRHVYTQQRPATLAESPELGAIDPIGAEALTNQEPVVACRQLLWLLYVGIGWFGVALVFWCLLVVAARADRRDAAETARAEPDG